MAEKEIRLDEKVVVRSLAPWNTGAARKTTIGDITIPAKGTVYLTREEIIAQAQNGNKLVNGIDGYGSHATWYIEDDYTRTDLGFDVDGKKQEFLTSEVVSHIFDLKTPKSFEDNIKKKVVTRAEKSFLMECIKTLGINDYNRIQFCIEHTGIKL